MLNKYTRAGKTDNCRLVKNKYSSFAMSFADIQGSGNNSMEKQMNNITTKEVDNKLANIKKALVGNNKSKQIESFRLTQLKEKEAKKKFNLNKKENANKKVRSPILPSALKSKIKAEKDNGDSNYISPTI